jgi:hypothetical protein
MIAGLVLAAMLVAASGCNDEEERTSTGGEGERQTQPKAGAPTRPGAAEGGGDKALLLWWQGRKAAAARQFLAVDWPGEQAFVSFPGLQMTQQQLAALSPKDRERKTGEIQGHCRRLRGLAAFIVDAGRKAASAGDRKAAEARFRAVQACGELLTRNPDGVLVILELGRELTSAASEELGKLQ